jgi:hypothetical protein
MEPVDGREPPLCAALGSAARPGWPIPGRRSYRRGSQRRTSVPVCARSVRPGAHWIDGATHRGYLREDFYDAWQRYLPPPEDRNARKGREEPAPSLTALTSLTPLTGGDAEDDRPCLRCGNGPDFDADGRCRHCTENAA